MERCKNLYIYTLFLVLSICIQGCGRDKEEEEQLYNLVKSYETAMKAGDYEQADSYWMDVDDNKYAHVFDEAGDDVLINVCETRYLECLQFDASGIEINGDEAKGDIDIYISNVNDMMNYLLSCVGSGELQPDSSGEEIKEKLEKHDFVQKWQGKIYFEKQNGEWKIKSMTED